LLVITGFEQAKAVGPYTMAKLPKLQIVLVIVAVYLFACRVTKMQATLGGLGYARNKFEF